jgi:hypothetical protein
MTSKEFAAIRAKALADFDAEFMDNGSEAFKKRAESVVANIVARANKVEK